MQPPRAPVPAAHEEDVLDQNPDKCDAKQDREQCLQSKAIEVTSER